MTEAYLHYVALAVEMLGIAVILTGIVFTSIRYIGQLSQSSAFTTYRAGLGRSILLGLEFLVAADIIDTVTVEPTLNSVLILAVIVLIRTFLSMSLEVEIEGKFPWQKK